MPRAIGNRRMNRLRKTKALRVRGCTPTCIAKKAIKATRPIGMVERGSLYAENHSMSNGIAFADVFADAEWRSLRVANKQLHYLNLVKCGNAMLCPPWRFRVVSDLPPAW